MPFIDQTTVTALQCYDKYMMAKLTKAAEARNHPDWAHGPEDSGECQLSSLLSDYASVIYQSAKIDEQLNQIDSAFPARNRFQLSPPCL